MKSRGQPLDREALVSFPDIVDARTALPLHLVVYNSRLVSHALFIPFEMMLKGGPGKGPTPLQLPRHLSDSVDEPFAGVEDTYSSTFFKCISPADIKSTR